MELEKRGIMLEKENGDLRGELRVSVGKIQVGWLEYASGDGEC